MDTVSEEKRSSIMSAVHNKNTKAELLVRRYLWSQGIRFRIYPKDLPGKPDIVIRRYKLAIFIHGCFWHGHEGCNRGRIPKSRIEYWKQKIKANKLRDKKVEKNLAALGWQQLVIWDCQLRTQKAAVINLPKIIDRISTISLKFGDA
jgi:DNA mismatch endonuclease (patch repair protein)